MSTLTLHALQTASSVSQVAPRLAWEAAVRGLLGGAADTTTATSAATNAVPVNPAPVVSPAPVPNPQTVPATPPPTTNPSQTPTSTDTFPTLLLTAIIWSTAAAALIIVFLPERTAEQRSRIRVMAVAGAAVPFVMTLIGLNAQINQELTGGTAPTFEERHQWITGFPIHVNYHLAVDGISLPLLFLSTLLFLVATLASARVESRVRLYFVLLLILETGVNGAFCAFDYVLFFLFYEVELIPMFLLISIWGGPRRVHAAWKFLGFTLTSSALLLAGILVVAFKAGQGSFDFDQVNTVTLTTGIATAGFWLTFVAFAIKLPVVPLHTWLPDAHVEASAPISVILAGILLKLGGYGMIRICLTAFPAAATHYSLVLVGLAVVSAIWGTAAALAQDDLKRLIAYGSVGHMAIVLLAIGCGSSIALNGAVLQMVAHGLITGMLFLLVGSVYERTRTRSIRRLGGLAWQMPRLTWLWVFAGVASIGLPFLAGFIAEFLVFTGAYPVHRVATILVMGSVLITTGYMLWALERAFFGPAKETFARVRDATTIELVYLLPVGFFIVLFGVLPGRLEPMINNGVAGVVTRLAGG